MKNKRFFFIAVLLCSVLPVTELFGQSAPIDLGFALSNGLVSLSVSGNGNCAGPSVEGTIKNNTSTTISIGVNITDCLYLVNSGKGQNMLATNVYLSGLRYITDGISRFIQIEAGVSVGIVFEAYCADFDKDNPTASESFRFSVKPAAVATIAAKIGRYNAINVNADLTKAKQIALWRFQGRSWEEIAEKIEFTSVDWEISTQILNF
jgi:hypothetical protein